MLGDQTKGLSRTPMGGFYVGDNKNQNPKILDSNNLTAVINQFREIMREKAEQVGVQRFDTDASLLTKNILYNENTERKYKIPVYFFGMINAEPTGVVMDDAGVWNGTDMIVTFAYQDFLDSGWTPTISDRLVVKGVTYSIQKLDYRTPIQGTFISLVAYGKRYQDDESTLRAPEEVIP